MEQGKKDLPRLLSLALLLPALLLWIGVVSGTSAPTEAEQTTSTAPTPEPREPIVLSVLFDGECRSMELERYLLGVVLGEMPASFETEALRAQAVAARTYTIKRCVEGRSHGIATVCTDYRCCQAYVDPIDYLADGGRAEDLQRVQAAVEDTQGQVLVYEGELIEAPYFSCAGGLTEAAVAVWGQDYPYLQSVASPGEENAAHYTDSKSFSVAEFQNILGISPTGDAAQWFGQIKRTAGGGVETMVIGGVSYRGTTLRTLLGLRSTAFTVSVEQGQIVFYTKGYGHRVGMSQYGANAMAREGQDYRQILAHYYLGTEIVQYCGE